MRKRGSAVREAASSVSSLSKKIIFIAAAVLIFYIMAKLSFSFGRSLFYADPADAAPGTDTELTITADDNAESIGERLYEEGVITNVLSFIVQGALYKTDFYPGTYTVNSSMTIKEMLMAIDEKADSLRELSASDENNDSEEGTDSEISGGYDGDALGAAAEGEDMADLRQEDSAGAGNEDQTASDQNDSITEIGGGSEGD